MPQLLSVSRAARLAGVSRGELQEKIRTEGLDTFEGQVRMSDLLRAYPHIDMETDPVFERVQRLKSHARPKRHYSDGWLPDPEVLVSRLQQFRDVLVRTKSALNASEALLKDVVRLLEGLRQAPEREMRRGLDELQARLREGTASKSNPTDLRAELFARDALLKLMTASVRIRPSGHEFFVEGSESILESALKAGLHLNYGCSSGNCGSCKARVVSGRVRKIREHDYLLSAREQQEGYVLCCSNTAVTDVVLEASEALTPEDLPYQQLRAQIKKVEPMEPDLVLVSVQTPRTQTLRFMAGQRVKLTAEDGSEVRLPIASCPCDGRNLQFLLRRDETDSLVSAVLSPDACNQSLELAGPEGGFTLHEESTAPAVLIGVGVGFGAIKSLAEHAIAIDRAASLHLYRLAASRTGSPLDKLCRAWNDSLDNFHYQALSQDTSPKALVERLLSDLTDLPACDLYLCGPREWVEGLGSEADAAGLDAGRWLVDILD
jgi:CDP-4-dehydro-6-deoxyglucose reductase